LDVAGSDSLDESVRAVLDQGDLDAWMGIVERREDVEQWGDGASRDHPTVRRPLISPLISSTAWRMASTESSAARACASAADPAAVRVAWRPERSMSVAPRSASSWRIWALTRTG